jgi:hypothetical protein
MRWRIDEQRPTRKNQATAELATTQTHGSPASADTKNGIPSDKLGKTRIEADVL